MQVIEMDPDKPKLRLASVFSGIGAIEYALIRLGIDFKTLIACDNDSYVKKSYFANYGISRYNWFDDIMNIDGGVYRGKIDLFVGGSPCQSFSVAGKRKCFDDERGLLFYKYFELIDLIRPSVFIYENVRNLLNCDDGDPFYTILGKMKEIGYSTYYNILDGKDFGIPQSRRRLFIIGFKDGRKFEFPKPRELKINLPDLLEARRPHSREYRIDLSKKFNLKGEYFLDPPKIIGMKYYLSNKMIEYINNCGTGEYKVTGEYNPSIAYSLVSSMHKMHRMGIDNYIQDQDGVRRLTPRECLRLMGFDDRFKIVVSDTQMYRQTGNSIIVDVLISLLIESGLQNNYKSRQHTHNYTKNIPIQSKLEEFFS